MVSNEFVGEDAESEENDVWIMPSWMEKYRYSIGNTGGNRIETMVNGHADPFSNLPLSTLQACVKSQVSLLYVLYEAGLLR